MHLKDSLIYEPVELAFGTSGLRGLVRDMTDLECYINIVGFLHFLKDVDGVKDGDTVYLAGDLRDSTPHIMAVVMAAVQDNGLTVVNCGKLPTPAVAYYALEHDAPCIMVTGSHIPADRNGIKFYKRAGEVLKKDELPIKTAVSQVRRALYEEDAANSAFSAGGELKHLPNLPAIVTEAETIFIQRFTDVFPSDSLAGKQVIVYQQSAVGRDILVTIFKALGAEVIPIERLDTFLPIDTENVTEVEKARFKGFSQQYPDAFAIISTDGDSDRPFVIDETGEFHRGDVLGCVVTEYVGAQFVALPISGNDAIDEFCHQHDITLVHTKIGSPYVVTAMQDADSSLDKVVGWEVNGGFMLGSDFNLNGHVLKALPTRDAALPIICSLLAARQQNCTVAELFARLPSRFTGGSLIDDVPLDQIEKFRSVATEESVMRSLAEKVFGTSGLGEPKKLDLTDGLRLIFTSGDVVHLRPSGNAPQFRVYTNADTQARADELAQQAIAEDGYIMHLLTTLETTI